MAQARLLQTVCAVALLAAAPAFAQSNDQPASTGRNNSVNAPMSHDRTGSTSMAPADRMGSPDDSSGMNMRSAHHADMSSHHMMHSRNDVSQSDAVSQLNDQSYQAAQRGEAFSGTNTMGSSMGSGSMGSGSMGSGSMGSGSMGSGSMSTGGMISPRSDPTGAVHANPSVDNPPGGAK
jgi:hypothetical protein